MNSLPSLLSYAIPLSILFYLLYSIRHNVSLIGTLPLFFLLGNGAYLPAPNQSLFGSAIPINLSDISFVFLLFSISFVRGKCNQCASTKINPISFISYLLSLYLFLIFLITATSSPTYSLHTLRIAKSYLYLPLGILLWNVYFSKLSIENMVIFIRVLCYITFPLSILYILSSTGLSIYSQDFYGQYRINGVDIIRDFATIPVFLLISFSFNFFFLSRRPFPYVMLIAFIGAIIATATRSFILSAIVAVAVYTILHAFYSNSLSRFFLVILRIVFLLFILYSLFTFGPESFQFSFDRFENLYTEGLSDKNVVFRVDQFNSMQAETQQFSGTLLGFGYLLDSSDSFYSISRTGDLMWASTLTHFGYIGSSIYALLFLVPIFTLIIFRPSPSTLSLYTLSAQVIIAALIMSFAGTGFPISGFVGAIPFAILSTLISRSTNKSPKAKAVF